MTTFIGALNQKFSWLHKLGEGSPRLLILIFAPLLVIGYSIWQGMFNLDPHHWGLMLSNAKDLAGGALPYKDIFIQYGVLTTLVHSVGYIYIGSDLRTLIGVTACFYAFGLLGLYFLSLVITKDKALAIFSFISAVLLHPIAIYPWSNYIAFPFLVFGALFLFSGKGGVGVKFFTGFLFGLAVLAREGLFPALVIFFLIYSICNFLLQSDPLKVRAFKILMYWLGFSAPLIVFFSYLQHLNLLHYWYDFSILMPKIYMDVMMPNGLTYAFLKLLYFFFKGILELNARIIFFAMILMACFFTVVNFIISKKIISSSIDKFLLSVFTLLLITATLHSNEIFRLATSVIIGISIYYYLARKFQIQYLVFIIVFLWLIFSLGSRDNGNYFATSSSQRAETSEVKNLEYFSGQWWPINAINFYQSFQKDMLGLSLSNCGIKYFYNSTHDAFLPVLSPFKQYQVAPFMDNIGWTKLRPEINVEQKISDDKDIVLFLKMSPQLLENYNPPSEYKILRRYSFPKVVFFDQEDFLLILVPKRCSNF